MRLDEPSCVLDMQIKCDSFEGVGTVEAARGSLLHRTKVSGGKIERYDIVTPTQWNLSNDTEKERGIAIQAMRGLKNTKEATFVFRTFDVCSVCTVQ